MYNVKCTLTDFSSRQLSDNLLTLELNISAIAEFLKTCLSTYLTYPFTYLTYPFTYLTYPFTYLTYPFTYLIYPFTYLTYPFTYLTYPFTYLIYPFTYLTYPFTYLTYPFGRIVIQAKTCPRKEFLPLESFRGPIYCGIYFPPRSELATS